MRERKGHWHYRSRISLTLHPGYKPSRDAAGRILILEDRNSRRLTGQPQLLPAPNHPLIRILRQLGALGERLVIAIVHARIDECLRAPWPDLGRIEARIEIGAPGLAQDVDRLRGALALRRRPSARR